MENKIEDITKMAEKIATKYHGVCVYVSQTPTGDVRVQIDTSWDSKAGIQRMKNAKKEISEYLLDEYRGIRWVHRKIRGYKVWNLYSSHDGNKLGVACGMYGYAAAND